MAVVTIQMAPPPQPPQDQAVLDACERAFGRGRCAWARADEETVRAEVQWKSAGVVEISVGQGANARSVRLVFVAGDPEIERYKAIGYAIGSGARSVLDGRETPAAVPASGAGAPDAGVIGADSSERAPAHARYALHGELRLSLAPAGKQTLYGGGLGLVATAEDRWSAILAGRFRQSPRDEEGYTFRSVQTLVGVGGGWRSRLLGFELRSGVALDWLHVSIRPLPPRNTDSQSGMAFGGFAEALVSFFPESVIAGQVGVGVLVRPGTVVQVDGSSARELPGFELSLDVGLRVRGLSWP